MDALGVSPRGEAIPPARLGRLLHAARRRQGVTLRWVARKTGIDRATLAAYERGTRPVSDDHLALLAGAYGGNIAALAPDRDVVRVDATSITAGGRVRVLESATDDAVLGSYVDLIRELRGARPGEPLPLRTADLEALAVAIGSDVDDVEARIVEILGCTPEEAAVLHRELLSRRLLRPVASVALGAAALAGLTLPQFDHSPTQPYLVEVEAQPTSNEASPTTTTVAAPTTTSTTAAPPTTAPPATSATSTTSTTSMAPSPTPPPPPAESAPPVASQETSPPPHPDDPPIGLLPGEEFVVVQE